VISTAEALERLFALASPLGTEQVPLAEAAGRVLAADVVAARAQPPFAASAMDGYALRATDIADGASFEVIGEAPAGRAFAGRVGPGEAVRIFTGAPVPEGADFVVIQEDTENTSTGIRLARRPSDNANIRPAGGDFAPGDRIAAPRRLRPADIALAAAMNAPAVTVRRRPEVAVIATGDELVQPGEEPGPDQIVASNALGLKALFEEAGAAARLLPIARDTEASLEATFRLARGADLIVTIGGASVGDHDLVAPVAARLGMERAFYKVAMRPGKPLMAGRMGEAAVVGLPGNPVSAMVCGHIFVLPLLRAMLGFPPAPAPRLTARLACAIGANGPREHYMRARREGTGAGKGVAPFDRQDSSLLSILSGADALLVRPPGDPPREAGAEVEIVPLTQA
jgi:molybdopterin molybdotransferase